MTQLVYVVSGLVDYEGSDIIAVVTSKKLVQVAIDADKDYRKANGQYAYDDYGFEKMRLDTVVHYTRFEAIEGIKL
jgi:hypothetical protein